MQRRKIVTIGASAGGVEALTSLCAALPADFDAVVFVVLHVPIDSTSILPQIIDRHSLIPATHARDEEIYQAGHIYVAPPNFHMQIDHQKIYLVPGPRENRVRPAIDPLFRSAANCCRADVIGVVLTGSLHDGTAGLLTIKRHRGIAIVQDPNDAISPEMPLSAIESVKVDYVLPLRAIAHKLVELVMGPFESQHDATSNTAASHVAPNTPTSSAATSSAATSSSGANSGTSSSTTHIHPRQFMNDSTTDDMRNPGGLPQIAPGAERGSDRGTEQGTGAGKDPAQGANLGQDGAMNSDDEWMDDYSEKIAEDILSQEHGVRESQSSIYTCPDCGGVLWQFTEGDLIRFRCHTGHIMSAEDVLASQAENAEDSLWSAVRSLQERSALSRQLAVAMRERGDDLAAARYEERAVLAEQSMTLIRQKLLGAEALPMNGKLIRKQFEDGQA